MEKKKRCNPGTLRSYPRSTALGVSSGLSVTESSSSADLVIPTHQFPASALVLGNLERVSQTATVAEPEDIDGWTTVAVAQEGSRGVDGSTSAAEENEEASRLQWIRRELMDCRVLQKTLWRELVKMVNRAKG